MSTQACALTYGSSGRPWRHLILVDGGDRAGGPVGGRGAFIKQGVQLDLEIRVTQLSLVLQVGISEAER